ncbi:MAG: hypothetical protein JNL38_34995 [Myxococcales bacterium]|nr:hypothetical protein [Myxococcales bacterium]
MGFVRRSRAARRRVDALMITLSVAWGVIALGAFAALEPRDPPLSPPSAARSVDASPPLWPPVFDPALGVGAAQVGR